MSSDRRPKRIADNKKYHLPHRTKLSSSSFLLVPSHPPVWVVLLSPIQIMSNPNEIFPSTDELEERFYKEKKLLATKFTQLKSSNEKLLAEIAIAKAETAKAKADAEIAKAEAAKAKADAEIAKAEAAKAKADAEIAIIKNRAQNQTTRE